ncbi:OmpL47-type beta-barrel domain-containing protein [Paenibacillus marinisediminis]
MRKRFRSSLPLLVSMLLVLQLFFPIANVYAQNAALAGSSILPPSNLDHQLVTPSDVKLTWNSVYQATGYNIYEIGDGQLNLLGTTKSNYYNINALSEGSYTYVVSTLSAEGESGPCAPITVNIVYPIMAAPATLTYTFQNGNDLVLNWGSSQYAETYSLYQIGADGEKTLVSSLKDRTYKITNAPAGTYTYAVSAVSSKYGESPLSNPLEVTVGLPVMAAPGNLAYTVTNGGKDINLKWSSATYANSYKVYQIIDDQKVLKDTVTGTSVTFSNMSTGTYVYEVHSYSDRFGESEQGSQISVTLGDVIMAPPSNLSYVVKNGNDITLSWATVANANSYKVYQIVDGQKVLKSTITGTTVTYTNQPSGVYLFEVYSYSNSYGESPDGSQVTITLNDVAMAAPDNFAYKINNGNDIVLTWGTVVNVNNYKVYQIIDGQKVLKSTATSPTVTFSNMPTGDYSYEVHSYSTRFGESPEGSKLTFTLAHPAIQPPQNLVQKTQSATSFSLSWDAASYANSYKVYQIIDGQKVLKSTVTGTSVAYTNMTPGEYTYEVYTYSTRFGESAEGSTLTFTLTGQTMQAPTNLTYTITNGNDITLKWTASSYATSYKVYQVIDGQHVLKSTVTGTSVSYTNMPEGDYDFVIKSFSTVLGESPEGAEVNFSLVLPTMTGPGNLAFTIKNGNNVVLTWATVPYANSYKVYELVDGQEVLKATVTSLTATIANVPAGDHIYVVHSVSTRFGESAEGSKISLNLDQLMMEAPGNLTQSISNGNNITLKWNSVTYATAYKIYQIIDGEKVLKSTVTTTSVTYPNMPAGDYTFEVHSFSDRFGESIEGSQISLTLVAPIMQAPSNLKQSIANGNDIILSWGAATYATNYKVYQIINGEKVLKSTVTGTSISYPNMPAGDYTFEVHSFSDRFGESDEGSQVSLTLVFPIMQAPANFKQSIANGNDIRLSWTAATYATNYKVYQIIDGEKVLKNTVTGTSVSFSNMPAGDYSYEIHSYSTRFGESPEGSTVDVTLVWPVVQPPTLTATIFNANNLTFTWPTVTWANEYRLYEIVDGTRQLIYKGTALSYKVYNLSEDTHQYEITAYSTRFGESAPSERVVEEIIYPVMQPPVASLKLTSDTSARISWNFVTYANGYNVYEIIEGKPVLLTENLNNLSYTVSNLSYADHEYYVTSYSNSFGESDPSNIVIAKLILDTTPPVTKANVPEDWTNQSPIEVTLSATDDITGVAKTYYAVNDGAFVEGHTLSVSEEGVTKISFYSVDKVGNTEAANVVYVKIDKTAPVTKATTDLQSAVINLTATDEQSGILKTLYSVNGADYVEGTTVTLEKEGANKVSFYSIDKAGNKEPEQTVEATLDRTPPVTTADAPSTWSKDDVTIRLTATDALSGVAKTFYSVDGSAYAEGTSFTISEEGIHKIAFYSVDAAGNIEAASTADVKIDKSAPVITMNLNEQYDIGDKVQLTYEVINSLSGIVSEKMTVVGPNETIGTVLTNGTVIQLDKPGVYSVIVTVTNAAGTSTTIQKQFTVATIFDYVLFAGDPTKTFTLSGSNSNFSGKVHVNGNAAISGSKHKFDVFEYGNSLKVSGSGTTIASEVKSTYTDMIQISADEYKNKATTIYKGNKHFSGSNIKIDGIVFVDGDVTISGSQISGTGTIFATGSIKITGSGLKYQTNNDLVAFYSLKDIEMSGSNNEYNGLFYAPNGSIKISGSKTTVHGSLIAKEIRISGSNFNAVYDPRYKTVFGSAQ